jgi:hypothetical protein
VQQDFMLDEEALNNSCYVSSILQQIIRHIQTVTPAGSQSKMANYSSKLLGFQGCQLNVC